MKRIVGSFGMIALAMLLAGVSFHGPAKTTQPPTATAKKHKPSCGYTIIEYGLGIDCNGDTVKISKTNGAQVLTKAAQRQPELGEGGEDHAMAMQGW
jgi:hypothetical protein